jgi:hypothetical protein
VTVVVTLLAHGCPLQAIMVAFGLDEGTVTDWHARAAAPYQRVQAQLVEQPRDLGQGQADELWDELQGRKVWMAMALHVSTRLWLGGVVSPHRDRALTRTRGSGRRCDLGAEGPRVCLATALADLSGWARDLCDGDPASLSRSGAAQPSDRAVSAAAAARRLYCPSDQAICQTPCRGGQASDCSGPASRGATLDRAHAGCRLD